MGDDITRFGYTPAAQVRAPRVAHPGWGRRHPGL